MSSETLQSANISRSWFNTLFFSGIGLGLLVLAFFLWQSEHPCWCGFSGLIGAFVLFTGLVSSGETLCPICSNRLFQLMAGSLERCSGCGTYFDVRNGRILEVDAERIAEIPEFAIPLPDSWVMPSCCCFCGQAADREEEITIQLSYPSDRAYGMMRELVKHGVQVPHCSNHTGGAKLDNETPKEELTFESLAGTTGAITTITVLKVRSYRFYCEFITMNSVFQGRTNSFVARTPES